MKRHEKLNDIEDSSMENRTCVDIIDHCRLFLSSEESRAQFRRLDAIADMIDPNIDDVFLSEIINLGLLDYIQKCLTDSNGPNLLPIAKFCRKWSLIDDRMGHIFFDIHTLNAICDLIQSSFDSIPSAVCENLILAIHNLVITCDLGQEIIDRILDLNLKGYSFLDRDAHALQANILLTGVLAFRYSESLDRNIFKDMTNALMAIILRDQACVGPLGLEALNSLFHVMINPEVQKQLTTPFFLQDILPRYLCDDRRRAYSVFCRLATSPDELIRTSTLNLTPLHLIAEMFRDASDDDKVTFCETISCVIESNADHMFQFFEQEIIETIAIFLSSGSFAVKFASMRCISRIFSIAETDYASQWRLMKALLPVIGDIVEDNPDEFKPLVLELCSFIEKMPAKERSFYFSKIANLVDKFAQELDEQSDLVTRWLREILECVQSETNV